MAAGGFLTFILDSHSNLANVLPFFSFFLIPFLQKSKIVRLQGYSLFWLTVALLLEIYLYLNTFGADD